MEEEFRLFLLQVVLSGAVELCCIMLRGVYNIQKISLEIRRINQTNRQNRQ